MGWVRRFTDEHGIDHLGEQIGDTSAWSCTCEIPGREGLAGWDAHRRLHQTPPVRSVHVHLHPPRLPVRGIRR